jgi:hypothetical protein
MAEDRVPHPNALPNYQSAVILQEKLEKYCLDPQHVSRTYGKSSGKHKARVFKAMLGFEKADWELLKDRILESVPFFEAKIGAEDQYGQRYNVHVQITGPNGKTGVVLTAWIVRPGTDYPFLTSARCVGV